MFFKCIKALPFLFLLANMHFVYFVLVKSFRKKLKIKRFEIALMTSSTLLLITSLIEMLELPSFGHMTICTK